MPYSSDQPALTAAAASRLEQVPADRTSADLRLARNGQKLEATHKIAAIDTDIAAYITTYNAMCIAVTAHLLSVDNRVHGIAAPRDAEAADRVEHRGVLRVAVRGDADPCLRDLATHRADAVDPHD